MRAGRAIRMEAALRVAGDKLCECGHQMREHRELRYSTLELVDGQIVETKNPDYRPLDFHCHVEGCDCIRTEPAR